MNQPNDLPPIDFVLTPQDRDRAALAKLHLEAHRRRENERNAFQALHRWTGERHRGQA
jgi:hypothetical protein